MQTNNKNEQQQSKAIYTLLFLLTVITFFPSIEANAQRIASGCTSNNFLDVQVIGIHNTGSKNIAGLNDKVKKVVVECTCRGRLLLTTEETCPNKITLTVNGQNKTVTRIVADKYSTWWGNDAGLYEGDMFIYRYVHSGPVTSIKYNAPSSASDRKGMRGLAAWVVKNDPVNANQPQSIFVDEFHFRHPARCFNVPIKPTLKARDITINLVVSEIQNNLKRYTRYSATALNANGTVIATLPAKTFNRNNDAGEVRLDKLSFKNVPASATKIKVCIESPQHPDGTSFMIGSIAITSDQDKPTLTCPAGKTVACASEIKPGTATYKPACPDDTRKPTVSNNPTIHGEPNCPGTTYTYTFSVAGLSCKQVFTIGNNHATAFVCPPKVKVTCAEDIHPVFPDYVINCDGNATELISEPVTHGTPGCPGTTYTYTYTLTDACGRSTTCEQVFEIGHNDGPTISNHGNIQVSCESNIIPVFPEYTTSCTAIEATETIEGPDREGPAGCPGTTYTYTYTITDACGRSASCVQVFEIVGDSGLTIACPHNVQVVCPSEIKTDFPEVTGGCDGHVIQNVCGPVIDGLPGEAGSVYTYMYTATDNCGNSVSCEQIFEIASGCNTCNLQDWLALKAIYEATNGLNWHFQEGWEQVTGNKPPPNCNLANMHGVTLDRKTKRVIDLFLFGLKGVFPAAIGDLTELEYLTIVGADFEGSSIPPSIGDLEKLKELILADNNIGGQLPAELAKLNNLTLLTLNDNQLSGSYPTEYELFCEQLTHHRFQCNASISDGNYLEQAWEEFCTTGVCKNYKRARLNDYTIHPNPSTGIIAVQFEMESNTERKINLYDNSGKLYESVSYKGLDNSIELDLSELPKGIYIIEIQDNFSTTTEKVILQ